jgi:ATP-binding cassette, subfamily B, bacterial PglK
LLKQYRRIFNARQKRELLLILAGLIVCSMLDALAVALMGSFTIVLLNMDAVFTSASIGFFYNLLGCRTPSQFLMLFAVAIAAIYFIRGVLRFYLVHRQAKRIGQYRADISRELFTRVVMQPYRYHVKRNSAQLQQLLTDYVNNTFSLLDNLLQALSAISVGVCITIVLLMTSWVVTLSITAFLVILLIFTNGYVKRIVHDTATQYNRAFSNGIKWINQTLGAIKDIIAKNHRGFFIDEYSRQAKTVASTYARYVTWQSAPKFIIETLVMVGLFLAAAVIIGNGESAGSFLPLLATFALAATRLIPTFSQLSSTLSYIAFCKPSVAEVYRAFYREDAPGAGAPSDEPGVSRPERIERCIQLDHVGFSFDDSESPLLTDVSLTIGKGESVAFVGPSGSGKTTLADIILGVYAPNSGRVTADGVDIHKNPEWWAQKIGYIPQFIYLSDDTIRANVAFGIQSDSINDERVWQCLEKAQMKAFTETLPEGLDTNIGENGTRLSGGQRQRVGIARALYFEPEILVMDEATSSLDSENEAAIIKAVNALAGEKTLIIIAHRLTTIQGCGRVYRVENGSILLEDRETSQQ